MRKSKEAGVALLITVLLLSLSLFLVMYFLSFSLTENKIANSQLNSNSTYYLAESAINDALWRLQNDTTWKTNFNNSTNWSTTTTKTNPLGYQGNYVIGIYNYSPAHATVIATATIKMNNGKDSHRVVKVNVYRAAGGIALGGNSMLSDSDIAISNSEIDFIGGFHSNGNITISNNSDISVTGNLEAVGAITNQNGNSTLSVSSTTYGTNQIAGAAPSVTMPAVDFNSAATSSLKSQAARIYTAAQFVALCGGSGADCSPGTGITYVIGNVTLNNNVNLSLNDGGTLVVEGNLVMTLSELHLTSPGNGPSGIFASGNMELKKVKSIEAKQFNGVLYSNGTLTFGNIGSNTETLTINGGVVARNIIFSSPVKMLDIVYNASIVNKSLPSSAVSPVISTDHWEEEY